VSDDAALRRAVIETARALGPADLGVNRSGNVSARWADGFLVTPTGVPYEALEPGDIVFVPLDGAAPQGRLLPSSETPFHLAIYRARPELSAIVHSHSPHATALACTGRGVPPFHYMVAAAGGASILCAPYATFGSEALSRHAVEALAEGRRACLLANHGQIACGASCWRSRPASPCCWTKRRWRGCWRSSGPTASSPRAEIRPLGDGLSRRTRTPSQRAPLPASAPHNGHSAFQPFGSKER
jgi:L-fuculose-phosphate aldolase